MGQQESKNIDKPSIDTRRNSLGISGFVNPVYSCKASKKKGSMLDRYTPHVDMKRRFPLSPVCFSFQTKESYNFTEFRSYALKGIEKDPNYGVIPLDIIHNILLFIQPKELPRILCTCNLIHRVGNTPLFWKCYNNNYFKVESESRIINSSINWKKQFFKRFSTQCTDSKLRKRYSPKLTTSREFDDFTQEMGDDGVYITKQRFNFAVLGKDGIGKREFCRNMLLDEQMGGENDFFFKLKRMQNREYRYFIDTSVKVSVHNTQKADELVENDNMMYRVNGYILCFNLDDYDSFKYLEKYVSKISRILDMAGGGYTPKGQHRHNVILVGLKSELSVSKRAVKREEIRIFTKKNDFKGYIESSVKFKSNVFLPFGLLVSKQLKRMRQNNVLSKSEMVCLPFQHVELQFDRLNLVQKII